MKVLIDILTPKQGMLFSRLSEVLEKRGHQVLRTTREYREITQFFQLKGIEAKTVGRHGGGTLAGKLFASQKRILKLSLLFEEWKPDIAVSFSSPETARVAFGLGIPHVCVNDSPHAEAVARLTVPLSKMLLTTKFIPKEEWTGFGISTERIVQYNALDAWAWLKDFKPDEKVLTNLCLDKTKPIITLRTEETFAAYLLGKLQSEPLLISLIEKLLKMDKELQIVVIPRYGEQLRILRKVLKKRAVVCGSFVDGPSLLSHTSVFVGAGGTMTTEAAIMGIPTFSCYPDSPFLIEKYLIERGLIIRERDSNEVAKRIIKASKNIEFSRSKQKEKAQELTKNFEDPIQVITDTLERTLGGLVP